MPETKCTLHPECAYDVGHTGTCNDGKGNWFWMPFEPLDLGNSFKINTTEIPYITKDTSEIE